VSVYTQGDVIPPKMSCSPLSGVQSSTGVRFGATAIVGLDIVGPVWQGWTLADYGLA